MEFLRQEMSEWTRGIRWVFATLLTLPLYYITRLLLAAPQAEQIFEDMLGSKEKLPLLTKIILRQPELIMNSIWLLAIVSVILICRLKNAKHVWITTILTLVILMLCVHLISAAFVEPLGQVITNLSGGG